MTASPPRRPLSLDEIGAAVQAMRERMGPEALAAFQRRIDASAKRRKRTPSKAALLEVLRIRAESQDKT